MTSYPPANKVTLHNERDYAPVAVSTANALVLFIRLENTLMPVQRNINPVNVYATRHCHVYIDFAAINFDICGVSEFIYLFIFLVLQQSLPHVEVRTKCWAD